MFELDPMLESDGILLASLPLCELLLMNDRHYPWFVLVPRKVGIRELLELSAADRQRLARESDALAHMLLKAFHAEKLNIAALGNVVAQLHVHHIARYVEDVAWPKPVWGVVTPEPYAEEELLPLQRLVKENLLLDTQETTVWYI